MIRLVGVYDKVNLRVTPKEMYVVMELEDEETGVVAEIPLGPVAHAKLFESFPDLLAGAKNVIPAEVAPAAAKPAPKPKAKTAPPSVSDEHVEEVHSSRIAKRASASSEFEGLTLTTADASATEVDDFMADNLGGDDGWDDFEIDPSGGDIVIDPEHHEEGA